MDYFYTKNIYHTTEISIIEYKLFTNINKAFKYHYDKIKWQECIYI